MHCWHRRPIFDNGPDHPLALHEEDISHMTDVLEGGPGERIATVGGETTIDLLELVAEPSNG
jgi:hypothetical protein